MEKIKKFARNTAGKDYIVGDIHGMFHLLEAELAKLGFDKLKDRLFSVGDLVDRGPNSEDAIDWLDEPWFHAVRGNHEQMAIDYFQPGKGWAMDKHTYEYNGGKWFIDMPTEKQAAFANAFDTLPLIIELETDMGTIGILHAEAISDDWDKTKEFIETQPTIASNCIMWGRDKIKYKDDTKVLGIDFVVVGHTPQNQITTLGNVIYIDTGAVYGNRGHFTILNANTLKQAN